MIREGSKVKWNWGSGTGEGKVEEIRTIKGTEVTRKGEAGNKALLIKQDDGDRVLQLESEVEKI